MPYLLKRQVHSMWRHRSSLGSRALQASICKRREALNHRFNKTGRGSKTLLKYCDVAWFRPDIPQREGQIATKQKLFRPCPAWALICAEGNADEITDKFTSELVRAERVKGQALKRTWNCGARKNAHVTRIPLAPNYWRKKYLVVFRFEEDLRIIYF